MSRSPKSTAITRRLNGIFLLSAALNLSVAFIAYIVLEVAYTHQMRTEMESRLKGTLESQIPMLVQEFVNERFYAAIVRGQAIALDTLKKGEGIALFDGEGKLLYSTISETGLSSADVTSHSNDISSGIKNGYIFVGKAFLFVDETIGYAIIYSPEATGSSVVMRFALALTIAILVFSSLLVSFLMRRFVKKHVGDPIISVCNQIPRLISFVKGEIQKPELVDESGTAELDKLCAFIIDLVLEIRRNQDLQNETAFALARSMAIAQTTQMLAHDVRKPFSMIGFILNSLQDAKSFSEVQDIVTSSAGEVRAALASVTGMLQDVMEIGSGSTVTQEPASVSTLIDATLREACRVYQECEVQFEYGFKHQHMGLVDTLKVQRVLSNIVGNAIQASGGKGRLWIRTVESDGMIEYCVGNSGSVIPSEHLAHLFDAFYTKGKKGGTGLGLAIAKKIVEAHGGSIRCESTPNVGVEFYFTLPIASQIDPAIATLPKTSREVHESFRTTPKMSLADEMGEIEIATSLEDEIVKVLANRTVNVLILDDEAVYRNALAAMFSSCDRLAGKLKVTLAKSSSEALKVIDRKVDIGIFDFDLGENSLNGLETLAEAKKQSSAIKVCLHSNRMTTTHNKVALEAGAFTFLPKPMSKAHLLRFLRDALVENIDTNSVNKDGALNGRTATGVYEMRPVAVLEDSSLFNRSWASKNKGRPLHIFQSPELFWEHSKEHPEWFDSLSIIITDNHFGSLSKFTGLEFAKMTTGKPIFLSSNEDFSGRPTPDGIFRVLKKEMLGWEGIQALVREAVATTIG